MVKTFKFIFNIIIVNSSFVIFLDAMNSTYLSRQRIGLNSRQALFQTKKTAGLPAFNVADQNKAAYANQAREAGQIAIEAQVSPSKQNAAQPGVPLESGTPLKKQSSVKPASLARQPSTNFLSLSSTNSIGGDGNVPNLLASDNEASSNQQGIGQSIVGRAIVENALNAAEAAKTTAPSDVPENTGSSNLEERDATTIPPSNSQLQPSVVRAPIRKTNAIKKGIPQSKTAPAENTNINLKQEQSSLDNENQKTVINDGSAKGAGNAFVPKQVTSSSSSAKLPENSVNNDTKESTSSSQSPQSASTQHNLIKSVVPAPKPTDTAESMTAPAENTNINLKQEQSSLDNENQKTVINDGSAKGAGNAVVPEQVSSSSSSAKLPEDSVSSSSSQSAQSSAAASTQHNLIKPAVPAPKPTDTAESMTAVQKSADVNRFAQAIGDANLFNNAKHTLKVNDQSLVNKIVVYYEIPDSQALPNQNNLIDPIIKLQQDIQAIKNLKPWPIVLLGNQQNYDDAIKIGENAINLMIENAKNTLLESEGVSQALKKLNADIANVNAIARTNPKLKTISADYERIYNRIHDSLLDFQNEVADLERNSASEIIIRDSKSINNAKKQILENLKKMKKNDPGQDAIQKQQKQIQLDLDAQAAQDKVVQQDANNIVKTLVPTENSIVNVKTMKQALTQLKNKNIITDPDFNKDVDNFINISDDKFNIDTVIAAFNTCIKDLDAINPDFETFLEQSKDLQVYKQVIQNLGNKIKSVQVQGDKQAQIDFRADLYVQFVGNNVDQQITAITSKLAALQVNKNALTSTSEQLKTELNEFNDNISAELSKLKNVTVDDLIENYNQVLQKLKQKSTKLNQQAEYNKNAQAKADTIWKDAVLQKNNDAPLEYAITTALDEFLALEKVKSSNDPRIKIIQTFLEEYKNTLDENALNEKIGKLLQPITDKLTGARNTINLSEADILIYEYGTVIYKLVTTKSTKLETIDAIVQELKKLVKPGQSLGWAWTKDEINRNWLRGRINDLEALKAKNKNGKLSSAELTKLINQFNENLSDDQKASRIPQNITQEEYDRILRNLLQDEHNKLEQNIIFRILNGAGKFIGGAVTAVGSALLPSPQPAINSKEQTDINNATQGVFTAKSVQEQETALHNVVRILLNANYGFVAAGATISAGLGAETVRSILLMSQQQAVINSQIQNNQNLTDDQKKQLLQQASIALLQDVANKVVSDKLGADLNAVQTGNLSAVAESALWNKSISLLDPTWNNSYQYNAMDASKPTYTDSFNNAWQQAQQQLNRSAMPAITNSPYNSNSSYQNSLTPSTNSLYGNRQAPTSTNNSLYSQQSLGNAPLSYNNSASASTGSLYSSPASSYPASMYSKQTPASQNPLYSNSTSTNTSFLSGNSMPTTTSSVFNTPASTATSSVFNTSAPSTPSFLPRNPTPTGTSSMFLHAA